MQCTNVMRLIHTLGIFWVNRASNNYTIKQFVMGFSIKYIQNTHTETHICLKISLYIEILRTYVVPFKEYQTNKYIFCESYEYKMNTLLLCSSKSL